MSFKSRLKGFWYDISLNPPVIFLWNLILRIKQKSNKHTQIQSSFSFSMVQTKRNRRQPELVCYAFTMAIKLPQTSANKKKTYGTLAFKLPMMKF